MLVLRRKRLESIRLDEEIVFTLLETLVIKVRLGIKAPRTVVIERTERLENSRSASNVAVPATLLPVA